MTLYKQIKPSFNHFTMQEISKPIECASEKPISHKWADWYQANLHHRNVCISDAIEHAINEALTEKSALLKKSEMSERTQYAARCDIQTALNTAFDDLGWNIPNDPVRAIEVMANKLHELTDCAPQ